MQPAVTNREFLDHVKYVPKSELATVSAQVRRVKWRDGNRWCSSSRSFGGWGLDARIGRITREHGDVEFWLERLHAERSKAVLVGAGATAYFNWQPVGSFSQPLGRWSDWLFPPGSFGDQPGTLDGTPVPAMSLTGMLAMKQQFPHLRNGRPWRQKDIDDIEILRELAAEEG